MIDVYTSYEVLMLVLVQPSILVVMVSTRDDHILYGSK